MTDNNENQVELQYLGCGTGLSSTVTTDSSSRIVMVGGHLSQALVIEGRTPKRMKSGIEHEYAKTTWKVVMPVTGRVVKVIERFPTRNALGSFRKNSETIVIYENLEAKMQGVQELGILTLKTHHSSHQSFGFKFKQMTNNQSMLSEGNTIPKGTVFCQSPNVMPNGDYAYGVETNVAYMSIPQIIEDGFVATRSFCEKIATTGMGTRMVNFGKKQYPLNIYGDENHYKPFPDIGDKIREDGLLFALRDYDDLLAVVDMSPAALMDYDETFDTLVFAEPGAEIIDVKVMHDHGQNNPPTPLGMEAQCQRYAAAQSSFYKKLLEVYNSYHRKNKHLQLTREFHRLLVEAIADDPTTCKENVMRTYRASPLDDWTVELKYAYRILPTVGFKITGLHGD